MVVGPPIGGVGDRSLYPTKLPTEATEIAGVDNVARAKKQGLTMREWTSRHEEAGVDIGRVDNVARRSKGGQRGSGPGGTKKQGWTTQE